MLLAWLKKRGARKTTALKSHASVAFSGGEALIEETVASRSPACQSSYKVEQARFLAVALAVGLALCWPVGLLAWLLCWLLAWLLAWLLGLCVAGCWAGSCWHVGLLSWLLEYELERSV